MINHWDSVWYHYRNTNELLTKDRIVVKCVLPGSTLAWNSCGARYQNWISNLTIHEDLLDQRPTISQPFNNILVLNAFELRYCSVEKYTQLLGKLCANLAVQGRLIFGVNSIFIDWNRTAINIHQMFDNLILRMKDEHQMQLTSQVLRPFKTDALNGDCFFIFNKLQK